MSQNGYLPGASVTFFFSKPVSSSAHPCYMDWSLSTKRRIVEIDITLAVLVEEAGRVGG